jgi:hypothetical protein
MPIAVDQQRFEDVEHTLMRLAQDKDVPMWLVEALKIANANAAHIIIAPTVPSEPPRFVYPH